MPATPHAAPRLRLGFIGAGRLATALAWGFARRGCTVAAVASRSRAPAEKLAAPITGCKVVGDPQAVLEHAELVFLTVPDDAIAPLASGLRWRAGLAAVHCSGATEVSALAAAAAQGAQTGGFHPMQTFTDPEAALASLPGCTVAIEAGEPLHAQLKDLAALLGCRAMHLPPGARVRYHAAGAYASQYLVALLAEAAEIWKSFGASEQDAIAALLPLARGTLASVERAGLAQGMPGPVSRGDLGTVRRHLEALRALDPDIAALYCELALRTLPLAQARGTLSAERAAEFRTLLKTSK
jgi:predicted short-subunit dehydrogenase-like oxidoreductase (DUF2520 family)